jgi:hypothetical protein
MATHEFVVPRSIPITSPASAEDDDCHLFIKFKGARVDFPLADRIIVEAERLPLRRLSCNDIVVGLGGIYEVIVNRLF